MKKIVLREDEMPRQWYNVVPDIPGGIKPSLFVGGLADGPVAYRYPAQTSLQQDLLG